MDDGKIVDLFLSRDENAILEISKRYGMRLRSISRNIGLSEEDAEEIENDTYLAAWDHIPPHEPRTYLFRFLAKITREKAIDRARSRDREEKYAAFVELSKELESVLPSANDVASEIEGREISGLISRYLRTETPERRIVFIRHYWFFESVKEISERFGISEGKIKTILFRVRSGLKKYLEGAQYRV
ncbi:MAG: RNA polymerase sigma factor [Lachnospiraceae bacterium]|nr:RNA polymerase sigma factor [Lachnospiraceae bacterium]